MTGTEMKPTEILPLDYIEKTMEVKRMAAYLVDNNGGTPKVECELSDLERKLGEGQQVVLETPGMPAKMMAVLKIEGKSAYLMPASMEQVGAIHSYSS